MKILTTCIMLMSPLMVNTSVAAEQVSSVKDVSGVAKKLQKELQTLYLNLKSAVVAKTPSPDTSLKKLMAALQLYNSNLHAAYLDIDRKNKFTDQRWKNLNVSLEKVKSLTLLLTASADSDLLLDVRAWIRDAQNFEAASEKYAARPARVNATRAMAINFGGQAQGKTRLTVEDFSLGLNTRKDRIDFVERLTQVRAAENRIFARGYTTPGGYPRNYPAAYIYSNGAYGNNTTLGRRDSLRPIYNRQRQPVRRTAPRIQIRVK